MQGNENADVGPILYDRFKEKILKPWKCVHCVHFLVCVCVCVCARVCMCVFSFEIKIFMLSVGFSCFVFSPYITLVNVWFQATGHNFSPRNVIFGLREPCTIRN